MSTRRRIWTTPLKKAPGTIRTFCIDATKDLVSGTETLTGSPTVTATPSGLTLGTPEVNDATFTDVGPNADTVATGHGVKVSISGGKLGDVFELITVVGTTPSGETIELATKLTIE